MIKQGEFYLEEVFCITDRGLVFAGRIAEGIVSVGNQLEFTFDDILYLRRIKSVEMIRHSNPEMVNLGLLIETKGQGELENWKNRYKSNLKCNIYSTVL